MKKDGDTLNFEVCDGYKELSEEFKETIKEALERGYVADEEWKGVSLLVLPLAVCGC